MSTRFCCRVTRTSPPVSSARSAIATIWSPVSSPTRTGTPSETRPACFSGAAAHVVGEGRRGVELVVGQGVPEPALDLGAHAVGAEVVDHELEPRLDAGEAVAQVFLPGVEERAQHRQRLVDRDEDAEVAREPRHRGQAAADEDGEAGLAVTQDAHERDAVDLGRVAAVRAGGDRDLVLARQVGVVRVAVEEPRHLVEHRRHVEQLVRRDACDRAAGDVANGVAARTDGGQPDLVEAAEHLRQGGELEVVELDRLPRRQLARSPCRGEGTARRPRAAALRSRARQAA